MHECFPKHSSMGTARTKEENETDEDGKVGASMERSKAGTNKRAHSTQNMIILNNIGYIL